MKTRVVSSLVGLGILAPVVVFLDTLLLNIVIGCISLLAVWELLNATGVRQHKSLLLLSALMTLTIPFAHAGYVQGALMEIMFLLVLAFFFVLLRHHQTMRVEQVGLAFFFSTFVPLFFSCAVYLRDDFGALHGGFYLLLALGAAWLSDTGAYFVGIRFGKHKLAPVISPKKTVEGSIGGIITGTGAMLLLAAGYAAACGQLGYTVVIHYGGLLLVMPFLSVIGMMGDLSASAVKRSFGVKDYGHIMPGHGGIMDRFDSVLFTLPSVYLIVRHLPLVV